MTFIPCPQILRAWSLWDRETGPCCVHCEKASTATFWWSHGAAQVDFPCRFDASQFWVETLFYTIFELHICFLATKENLQWCKGQCQADLWEVSFITGHKARNLGSLSHLSLGYHNRHEAAFWKRTLVESWCSFRFSNFLPWPPIILPGTFSTAKFCHFCSTSPFISEADRRRELLFPHVFSKTLLESFQRGFTQFILEITLSADKQMTGPNWIRFLISPRLDFIYNHLSMWQDCLSTDGIYQSDWQWYGAQCHDSINLNWCISVQKFHLCRRLYQGESKIVFVSFLFLVVTAVLLKHTCFWASLWENALLEGHREVDLTFLSSSQASKVWKHKPHKILRQLFFLPLTHLEEREEANRNATGHGSFCLFNVSHLKADLQIFLGWRSSYSWVTQPNWIFSIYVELRCLSWITVSPMGASRTITSLQWMYLRRRSIDVSLCEKTPLFDNGHEVSLRNSFEKVGVLSTTVFVDVWHICGVIWLSICLHSPRGLENTAISSCCKDLNGSTTSELLDSQQALSVWSAECACPVVENREGKPVMTSPFRCHSLHGRAPRGQSLHFVRNALCSQLSLVVFGEKQLQIKEFQVQFPTEKEKWTLLAQ